MGITNRKDRLKLPQKALCIAVAAAFAAPTWAEEDDEVQRLIKPESSVSAGVGHVSGDNQRFGVYNGLAKEGTYGIGSFSIIKRDDDTGTWFRAEGRNIGLPTAEARIEHEQQGHWRYFLEVDQLKRYTPYEVHSGLQGAGTNYLTYPNTSGAQTKSRGILPDFSTERLGSKLGFSHAFSPELDFSVVFQNVDKKGERLFGRGNSTAQEFLAEPINSTTRQLDVVLNYTGDRLQLSGGYYGSWYLNADNQLNITGGDANLRNAAGPSLPFSVISLPPDNFAHQLHLSGGYQFTDMTRGNFKVAYSHAGQNDSFVNVPSPTSGGLPTGGLNASGRSDLGGRLDTTLVQLGVTSRPLTNLSLLGNLRYENRDDNTSVAKYIVLTSGASNSTNGFNEPRSLKVLSGKLEASYLLPQGYRLTGGVEREDKERSVEGVRVVGYREKTDETSYRLELQHSLSESLNGSVAYIRSERIGSDYETLRYWSVSGGGAVQGFGGLYSNRVQPIYIANRNRDKLRLFADWTPIDALTFQLAYEGARDDYGHGRDWLNIGPRSGDAQLYSLDATWTVTEKWRVNGWLSRSETRMNQAAGNGTNYPYWSAGLVNNAEAVGLGVRGKVTGSFDIGADAFISRDISRYHLGGAAASNLPDIKYDQTTLKFFGRYAMNKDTSVRIDYIFDHRKTNDWTWNGTSTSGPYVYTDGTYLVQRPEDKVHFIGVSANYSFR